MPLPTDERVVTLARKILEEFHNIFGPQPGFRPAHAKGLMLNGLFRPTPAAATLSRAPHFSRESTPVTARFSNSTGLPAIPDSAPESNPRGLAIRFNLGDHVHTDIVAHSVDGFPTHTGEEFLEFLRAASNSGYEVPSPKPIELFLESHPAARRFVQTPKPFPSSLARENYFSVTAFRFTNADGVSRFGRYRFVPLAGVDYLNAEQVSRLRENEHYDELAFRAKQAPVQFKLMVQLADAGEVVDDATVQWPASGEIIQVGMIDLISVVADSMAEQKHIIFDPIPRVDGIEPSADPLLELRAAIYLLSGRERRAAKDVPIDARF